ncbi:Hsp70 family protein [Nocardia xishanensis]|uniref:Hsp70 family protein n=1 Tax=Nocardia xishanensis TaxID=238964 RepID=UPI0033F7B0FF
MTDGLIRPTVRTKRTALSFDPAGVARIGGIPQFDSAITDFADLARDPESVVVGGRLYSPANLIAAMVTGLLEAAEPSAGAVATYPAIYTDKQLALLRQALDLNGARHVMLVPEPVAAAEWLDYEHGPLKTGFVLVYDLGAASLDVSVVRVGPDWEDHPVVGKPQRSYDFGGRPLGDMIARYTRPGARGATVSMTSIIDVDGLRAEHIRDSFDVVRACLRSTGLSFGDIGRVLLVGGASRPAEVAGALAELGRPVVVAADPGHIVAVGAARFAARTFAPASTGERPAPRVAVFSSAAVASALAMSAATVFGGSDGSGSLPVPDRFPAAAAPVPADTLLYEPNGDTVFDRAVRQGIPATTAQYAFSDGKGYSRVVSSTARSIMFGPSVGESRPGPRSDPRVCCGDGPYAGPQYADPARFVNPLPFGQRTPGVALPGWERPTIPGVGLPSWLDTRPAPNPSNPNPSVPRNTQPDPDAPNSPGSPATGGSSTGGAATPGRTTDTSNGGAASGGTTGDPAGGSAAGGGGTSSGGTSSGGAGGHASGASGPGTAGGSTGGGAASGGGASSGGASGGGASPDGGASSGGHSSGGGAPSGGASGNGASSDGNSSGGGTSSGGTSGGGTSSGGSASSGGASSSDGSSSSGGGASPGGGASSGDSSGGDPSSHEGVSSGGESSGGGMSSGGGASSGGASTGGGGSSHGGASSGGGTSSGGGASTGGGASSPGRSGGTSPGGVTSGGGRSDSKFGGGAGGSGGTGGGGMGGGGMGGAGKVGGGGGGVGGARR